MKHNKLCIYNLWPVKNTMTYKHYTIHEIEDKMEIKKQVSRGNEPRWETYSPLSNTTVVAIRSFSPYVIRKTGSSYKDQTTRKEKKLRKSPKAIKTVTCRQENRKDFYLANLYQLVVCNDPDTHFNLPHFFHGSVSFYGYSNVHSQSSNQFQT